MAQVVPLRSAEHGPLDDAALVGRAREGNDWARGALYQRHGARVLGLLTRLLGSTSDAEDAAQDTFVEAFRDLGRLTRPAGFGAWVLRIAVHQAHRRFRRRALLSFIGLGSPELDATLESLADESISAEARAELGLVEKALARLAPQERLAWALRHVEGLELTEVAEALGVSLATAKRRLAAAQAAVEAVTTRAGRYP